MAILRYTASADNTITNAFDANLVTRGSGTNMGYADALEVFSIYGQSEGDNGQTQELSRILIKFPTTTMSSSRVAGSLPTSGNVSFYLKMYNAETPWTLPQNFTLTVAPLSRSWQEGAGLDMDNYQDLGTSNWMKANNSTAWTAVGGDYLPNNNFNVLFEQGYENLEYDITDIVENWINGSAGGGYDNHGLGVHLTSSQEAYFSSSVGVDSGSVIQNVSGATQSYYTKKFFARSTEFFFRRPTIEARWNSRLLDDRENFYYSSSLAPATDNLNNLYFYNYIRGRLVDYGGDVEVTFYSSSVGIPKGSPITLAWPPVSSVAAPKVATGIYRASLALTAAATPLAAINDVWVDADSGIQLATGSFYPELFPTYDAAPTFSRITSCTNLEKLYSTEDTARFRFFVRDRNWSPTLYVIATANNPTDIIASASYSVTRVTDNLNVIPYGTGADLSTLLSYDKDGNYFDLNMNLLEAGYMYQINLSYYNDSIGSWQEQPQTFKFRVE